MPLLVIDRHPSESDGHGNVGYIPMAITGYLEQAKLAAQRTFIPGTASAGSGHDGVATTAFLAWSKEASAGRCLDAALAMLVVHVTRRDPPPALRPLIEALRDIALRSVKIVCSVPNSPG